MDFRCLPGASVLHDVVEPRSNLASSAVLALVHRLMSARIVLVGITHEVESEMEDHLVC